MKRSALVSHCPGCRRCCLCCRCRRCGRRGHPPQRQNMPVVACLTCVLHSWAYVAHTACLWHWEGVAGGTG